MTRLAVLFGAHVSDYSSVQSLTVSLFVERRMKMFWHLLQTQGFHPLIAQLSITEFEFQGKHCLPGQMSIMISLSKSIVYFEQEQEWFRKTRATTFQFSIWGLWDFDTLLNTQEDFRSKPVLPFGFSWEKVSVFSQLDMYLLGSSFPGSPVFVGLETYMFQVYNVKF